MRAAPKRTITLFPGQKFGRLTVIERIGPSPSGPIVWLFECECGRKHPAQASGVVAGKTRSCGCLAIESRIKAGKDSATHGHARKGNQSRTYRTWVSMLARCTNEKHTSYPSYGGRGINVCERWHSFDEFLSDMGERPEGTSIDRIDNTQGYSPDNCRWADARTQQANTRITRQVLVDGEKVSFSEAARRLGMSRYSLERHGHARLRVPA